MSDNLKKIKTNRIDASGLSGHLLASSTTGTAEFTDTIRTDINMSGDFVPSNSGEFNLGASGKPWSGVYLTPESGNSTKLLTLGDDGKVEYKFQATGPTGPTGRDGFSGSS